MTVKQFDPKQTTTLETSNKVIAEQAKSTAKQGEYVDVTNTNIAPRVGFISLG